MDILAWNDKKVEYLAQQKKVLVQAPEIVSKLYVIEVQGDQIGRNIEIWATF